MILLSSLIALSSLGTSPKLAPKSINAFYIGHSLISDIPDMIMELAKASGNKFTFKEQFIPGSPLTFQWTEPTRRKSGSDAFRGYYDQEITGKTDVLVVTDSVPRGNSYSVNETKDSLAKFLNYAVGKNPRIKTWYYETWPCINSGIGKGCEWDSGNPNHTMKWLPRLKVDQKMWQSIIEDAKQKTGKGCGFMPGGTAFAKLGDAIVSGQVPGITKVEQLFGDDIHPNPMGKYFIACVQFSVLFQQSPVGLPHLINNRWGGPFYGKADWSGKTYTAPSATTARKLQEIAWESSKLARS